MTSTVNTDPPGTASIPRPITASPISAPAMWMMALGSFLSLMGFAWDVQWHGEVGPDTFFTVPHLFIYSGSAIVGLVCLVMSLRILNAGRLAGDGLSLAPIPVPYLIAGVGTAVFLACGLWDEWWHSIYGFDVTILSPPHIGLLTCIQIGMVGTVVAFSSAKARADVLHPGPPVSGLRSLLASRTLGVTVVTALSVSFLIFFSGLAAVLPFDAIGVVAGHLYLGVIFVVAFLFAASASRVRFAATSTAVVVIALKALTGWFTIAANDWYANLLGLFLRDEVMANPAGRLSEFSEALPAWWVVLIAAILVDVALIIGSRGSAVRRTRSGRLVVAVAGGVAGVTMGLYYAGSTYQRLGLVPAVTPGTWAALAVCGSAAGLVAWQLGNVARAAR